MLTRISKDNQIRIFSSKGEITDLTGTPQVTINYSIKRKVFMSGYLYINSLLPDNVRNALEANKNATLDKNLNVVTPRTTGEISTKMRNVMPEEIINLNSDNDSEKDPEQLDIPFENDIDNPSASHINCIDTGPVFKLDFIGKVTNTYPTFTAFGLAANEHAYTLYANSKNKSLNIKLGCYVSTINDNAFENKFILFLLTPDLKIDQTFLSKKQAQDYLNIEPYKLMSILKTGTLINGKLLFQPEILDFNGDLNKFQYAAESHFRKLSMFKASPKKKKQRRRGTIYSFDGIGKLISEFNSVDDAAIKYKIKTNTINSNIKNRSFNTVAKVFFSRNKTNVFDKSEVYLKLDKDLNILQQFATRESCANNVGVSSVFLKPYFTNKQPFNGLYYIKLTNVPYNGDEVRFKNDMMLHFNKQSLSKQTYMKNPFDKSVEENVDADVDNTELTEIPHVESPSQSLPNLTSMIEVKKGDTSFKGTLETLSIKWDTAPELLSFAIVNNFIINNCKITLITVEDNNFDGL